MFLENASQELPAGTCDSVIVVGGIKRRIRFGDNIDSII